MRKDIDTAFFGAYNDSDLGGWGRVEQDDGKWGLWSWTNLASNPNFVTKL